ncbi:MAG: FprA family A-type flavoprotein [Bacteroidales bacterium]
MYRTNNICGKVHYVGVNDRSKAKFENLWTIPTGVSYNSYLIADEKVALLDTVDISYVDVFIRKVESVLQGRSIDYLIVNHMEPDHSSSIRLLTQRYPNIKIVGNQRTFGMLEGFYGLHNNLLEVKEGDVLDLGHHKLEFVMTPMVHWPEVMMCYDSTEKVLFSADAFGCFGALDGGVIDREMNCDRYWNEMYRYYSNIVGKYGSPVQKAMQKLADIEINTICSLHGPVWSEYKDKAIAIYDKLSRYEGEEGVVIAYGTMYGNTEEMAEAIADALSKGGVRNIIMHNLAKSDISVVLGDVFRYKGLIVGSPTYSNELYPEVKSLMDKIQTRELKNRLFAGFGSFAWAGASVKQLSAIADKMKWEIVAEPVEMKQGITSSIEEMCYEIGSQMAKRVVEDTNK